MCPPDIQAAVALRGVYVYACVLLASKATELPSHILIQVVAGTTQTVGDKPNPLVVVTQRLVTTSSSITQDTTSTHQASAHFFLLGASQHATSQACRLLGNSVVVGDHTSSECGVTDTPHALAFQLT